MGITRRVLSGVAVIWIVITATFVISRVIPADPARAAAGLNAGAEQVAATAEALGLDQPLIIQYKDYMAGLATGDLGTSFATRRPLTPDLLSNLPATLELVIWSMGVYLIVGLGVGLWWGTTRSRRTSAVLRLFVGICIAMPVFWVALMLQMWLAGRLGWFPINGRLTVGVEAPPHITGMYSLDAILTGQFSVFFDAFRHLFLPVTALVIWLFALAARVMSASVKEEWQKQYAMTARAKGATRTRTLFLHLTRNALNPAVTVLGIQFGWLLGGTILVEIVFSWPGIGLYMYNGMQTFDYPVILAVTIVISVAFVVMNLLVDLIYPLLDPRLRGNPGA